MSYSSRYSSNYTSTNSIVNLFFIMFLFVVFVIVLGVCAAVSADRKIKQQEEEERIKEQILEDRRRRERERKEEEKQKHDRERDIYYEMVNRVTAHKEAIYRAGKVETIRKHVDIIETELNAFYNAYPNYTGNKRSLYNMLKEQKAYCERMEAKYGNDTSLLIVKTAKQRPHEAERRIVTPSLRYNVLQRDGFRCMICGRTAQDGVKLHVDHIIPVSKGGRSTMENLRTLCSECNLGKSDKDEMIG